MVAFKLHHVKLKILGTILDVCSKSSIGQGKGKQQRRKWETQGTLAVLLASSPSSINFKKQLMTSKGPPKPTHIKARA